MKKRLFSFALATVLLLGLCACGGKDAPASSTPASPSTSTPATNGTTATKTYPGDKGLTAIVAFAAGSATDLNMRMLATYMEKELGTTITVQNKEGGGGEIGWTALANAKNDGLTIGMINSPAFQLPIQRAGECQFTVDSYIPVANMVTDPGCVVVAADSPYNSLADLVEAAREKPGSVTVATTGLTTSEARACNTLAALENVEFQIVPYDGSTEGVNAVIGGHVKVAWMNIGDIIPQLKQGNIKALAVGSPDRSSLLPDVPTFIEEGLDFNQFSMRTLAVPAGTDPEIVAILEAAVEGAMNNPEFIEKANEATILLDYQNSASMTEIWKNLDAQWRAEWAERPWA